ncbi:MAG: MotA/TolQ/ExbB proton channel family protein [Acidobacteriota bacterium]|nr:MotA/TolQ/ExbB proton channel family protein [Acidobacteriota bacterium]
MTLPENFEAWVRLLTLLPILFCSIVGSAVTIAKWLQFRRARRSGERFIELVRGLDSGGDYGPALAMARADGSIPARLVEYALASVGAPRTRLVDQIEHGGRQLARTVEQGLDTVALIATLGPLLGLFGTVVGIVIVFEQLAGAEGVVSPSQLAGGIGTALYTTVAGLIVGMCALVSHRFLASRADDVVAQLETLGHALADFAGGHDA